MVAEVDTSEKGVAFARFCESGGGFGGRVHQDSRIVAEDSGQNLFTEGLGFDAFLRDREELWLRVIP
jgi:hypothetical protein